VVTLNRWKSEAMRHLAWLASTVESEEERRVLNELIDRIYAVRSRELPSLIKQLKDYCGRFGRWEVCEALLRERIEGD